MGPCTRLHGANWLKFKIEGCLQHNFLANVLHVHKLTAQFLVHHFQVRQVDISCGQLKLLSEFCQVRTCLKFKYCCHQFVIFSRRFFFSLSYAEFIKNKSFGVSECVCIDSLKFLKILSCDSYVQNFKFISLTPCKYLINAYCRSYLHIM